MAERRTSVGAFFVSGEGKQTANRKINGGGSDMTFSNKGLEGLVGHSVQVPEMGGKEIWGWDALHMGAG